MICIWKHIGYDYHTECGNIYHGYTFYHHPDKHNPTIVDNKCPWCGKPISRIEVDDDDYELERMNRYEKEDI